MSENLRRWMDEQGFSRTELANRLGLSYGYIYFITEDKRPVTDAFKWRFAEVFGYELSARLFGESEREAIHA